MRKEEQMKLLTGKFILTHNAKKSRNHKGFDLRYMWLLLVIIVALSVTSQAVSITPSHEPTKLTVGDKFIYKNEIPAGLGLVPMPLEAKMGDATALSPIFKPAKSPTGKEVFACTMAVYQPGPAMIPTFTFRASSSGDTALYQGDSLLVNIQSVLPSDTTGLDIADIRGPLRLRRPLWPYLFVPVAVALLAFGIKKLIDRFRKKISAPEAPPIPPWEMAFKRLDELKAARHVDFGRFKQYYFELSMIIRAYIEARYETLAVESTTYELEADEKLKELPLELYGRLFEMFIRADLAKFAKSIPTSQEAEADLAFAHDFVVQTKPAPVLAPETEQAAEEVEA
jgi:hypothetical protein